MNAALIFVAASVIGIDVGWEPLPDGGHEYIIQIQPQMLQRLRDGDNDLISELPSGLDIRRYRITVGTAKLPQQPSPSELRRPYRNQQATEGEETVVQDLPFRHAQPAASGREPAKREGSSTGPEPAAGHKPFSKFEPPGGFGLQEPAAADAVGEEHQARDHEGAARDDRRSGAFDKPREGQLVPEAMDIGERQRKQEAVPEPDLELGNPAHQANLVPQELKTDPKIRPLPGGANVSFNDNGRKSTNTTQQPALKSSEKPPGAAAPKSQSSAEKAEPPKPWWPLMFTIVLLFASLGGNAFLGWVAWGERNRSRGLLEKLHTAAGSS
jgi:hypothetical protein